MSFLPIAARELRVAARKRSTFWLRVVAAIVGLVIGAAFMLIVTLGGLPTPSFGSVLFGMLTWLALASALTAGIFFTSDALSEEKREGTLGFLFLTDLRGYDVVAGKLLATSLRGLFALLAIFPILGITLLMGGVTGAEFWRTTLALLNGLFCSLAVGLFVSALSHDSQRAMGGTFFWLVLLVGAGPTVDGIIAAAHGTGFVPRFSLTSPGYLFTTAGAWGRAPYWWTLLTTQTIALVMFGLTALLIPRTWQQKASRTAVATRGWLYSWKYGGPRRRVRTRKKLLDRDAILWLACRERWQSLGIWITSLLLFSAFLLALFGLPPEAWTGWRFLGPLFLFAFYLWAASQSCRFFIEARKSGLTELLLAAPLNEGQMVRGQWRALLRMYGWPVLLLLSLNLAGDALATQSWTRLMRTATTGTRTTSFTNTSGGSNFVTTTVLSNGVVTVTTINGMNTTTQRYGASSAPGVDIAIAVASVGASGITVVANLMAICWFGMWMGLTSKNANFATLKTLLFVQIIPVMVIKFSSQILGALLFMPMLYGGGSGAGWVSWRAALWPLITASTACLLSVGKDVFFIVWSRKRLYGSFREQAARIFNQPRLAIPPGSPPRPPPPAPPPMARPPVAAPPLPPVP